LVLVLSHTAKDTIHFGSILKLLAQPFRRQAERQRSEVKAT